MVHKVLQKNKKQKKVFFPSLFRKCIFRVCWSKCWMSFPKFTAAFSKAIFFPLLWSSAAVNISAKGIMPQLYFPFPKRLTTQSTASLLTVSYFRYSPVKPLYFSYTPLLPCSLPDSSVSDVRH